MQITMSSKSNLIIGRRVGETVIIRAGNEDVAVTVTEVQGRGCSLAVRASRSVLIDRLEVFRQKNPKKEIQI